MVLNLTCRRIHTRARYTPTTPNAECEDKNPRKQPQAALPERQVPNQSEQADSSIPSSEQASTRVYTFVQRRRRITPIQTHTTPQRAGIHRREKTEWETELEEAPPTSDEAASNKSDNLKTSDRLKSPGGQHLSPRRNEMRKQIAAQRVTIPFFNRDERQRAKHMCEWRRLLSSVV